MKIKNIAIITSGFLPLPATKGGAVENLIENFIDANESEGKLKLIIFSIYEKNASLSSVLYNNTEFIYIKTNFIIKIIDFLIFLFFKYVVKKENTQSYRFIIQRLNFLNKVSKYLKKNHYDKVVLENHVSQYLALKWRKNYLKYKNSFYYHCHNDITGTYGCYDIIKDTQCFICISEYIKKSIIDYLNVPEERFIVLKNVINKNKIFKELSETQKFELKKLMRIKDNDKIILFVGRIVPEKGIKELLTALRYVDYKNYKLVILGSSIVGKKSKTKFQQEIEYIVKELGDRVLFTGYVNYSDLYKYYQLCDFSVLPSIWNEPAGLTIIESMMFGKPTITTNVGGIPEYTNSNSSILLNKEDLIINIANSIEYLLRDEEKLKSLSEGARKLYLNDNINTYYDEFLNIINIEVI